MGYGWDEEWETDSCQPMSEEDKKVCEYFDYDWEEWSELSHYEKIDKRKIYRRCCR
jgi:hypothetical protein